MYHRIEVSDLILFLKIKIGQTEFMYIFHLIISLKSKCMEKRIFQLPLEI